MQGLEKHIHESNAKSNNNKQEVADETIEKIIPNLESNEIQMQVLEKHIHESHAKSNDNKITKHISGNLHDFEVQGNQLPGDGGTSSLESA